MAKLQSLVLKTKQPGAMQKLAQIQKLPVYSETEEVARVLKEMLADLQTRLDVLEDVDKKAKEIADEAYNKMVEWEGKLVALSDQADKAKEKMMVRVRTRACADRCVCCQLGAQGERTCCSRMRMSIVSLSTSSCCLGPGDRH
jgi:hypothetical protein